MSNLFFSIDKYRIHYRYYTADNNNAIIILVHGHGEHSGRYEPWASEFNQYNYAVCALDLPGHGLSSGQRGHIRHYDDYYKVLDEFIEKVRLDFPSKPIILYGHSMGGNICCSYVLDCRPEIKALILSSPWLELAIKPSVFRFWLAKTMYRIFPAFGDATNLNPNYISHIPEEVARYKNDPLVHDKITPGLFIPMFFKGLKNINEGRKINLPTLVFHGSGDQLTSHKASFKFSETSDKISFQLYPDGYHELHHDLCKEELRDHILDWMSSNIIMR
jgi:acylglycerol lipase